MITERAMTLGPTHVLVSQKTRTVFSGTGEEPADTVIVRTEIFVNGRSANPDTGGRDWKRIAAKYWKLVEHVMEHGR